MFGFRPNWNPPTAGNNTGASRLTTGASRPDKELAYGWQNFRPNWNPPTAGNNTGASRLTTGASRPNKELAYGEQNLRPNGNPPSAGNNTGTSRLTTGASQTKSSPTASKTFGLRPNWNRLTTGASRPDKELTYCEQNVRPLGGAKSEKHCKSVFVHFVVLFIFHHFIAIFLKQIKNWNLQQQQKTILIRHILILS